MWLLLTWIIISQTHHLQLYTCCAAGASRGGGSGASAAEAPATWQRLGLPGRLHALYFCSSQDSDVVTVAADDLGSCSAVRIGLAIAQEQLVVPLERWLECVDCQSALWQSAAFIFLRTHACSLQDTTTSSNASSTRVSKSCLGGSGRSTVECRFRGKVTVVAQLLRP